MFCTLLLAIIYKSVQKSEWLSITEIKFTSVWNVFKTRNFSAYSDFINFMVDNIMVTLWGGSQLYFPFYIQLLLIRLIPDQCINIIIEYIDNKCKDLAFDLPVLLINFILKKKQCLVPCLKNAWFILNH